MRIEAIEEGNVIQICHVRDGRALVLETVARYDYVSGRELTKHEVDSKVEAALERWSRH